MIVTRKIWHPKTHSYEQVQFEVTFDPAQLPVTAFYKAIRNKNGLSQIGGGAIVVRLAGGEDET